VSARTITLAPTSSTRLPSKPAVAARTKLLLEGLILGHIVVSPALIFGWGPIPCLGAAGAGWGPMLSFAAGSLVLDRWSVCGFEGPACNGHFCGTF
jgi:hypothetical protein